MPIQTNPNTHVELRPAYFSRSWLIYLHQFRNIFGTNSHGPPLTCFDSWAWVWWTLSSQLPRACVCILHVHVYGFSRCMCTDLAHAFWLMKHMSNHTQSSDQRRRVSGRTPQRLPNGVTMGSSTRPPLRLLTAAWQACTDPATPQMPQTQQLLPPSRKSGCLAVYLRTRAQSFILHKPQCYTN
jgi:hypothetical protein